MKQPKLYNTEEAAAILGTSTRTVKTYAAAGRLQAQKIGRAWQFSEESLTRFMNGEKQPTKTADGLTAFVPGLAADLRALRDYMIQSKSRPEAIADLDDILRDYIAPMELLTGKKA